jgi:hypothetical protein
MKIAALALLGMAVFALRLPAEGPPPPPEFVGIFALVNDEPITNQDVKLEPQYHANYHALATAKLPPEQFTAKAHDLELATIARLIDRKLVVQEFRREGRAFTSEQLDAVFASYLKNELNGDEKLFRTDLAWYGMTMADFRAWFDETTIANWMIRENVDKKITGTLPAGKDAERQQLLQAWYASLRAKACIEFDMGHGGNQPPPVEP